MGGDALKEALKRLLAQGDAAQDMKLKKMAGAKNSPPVSSETCDECHVPMVDGTCPKCGKSMDDGDPNDDAGLASILEQGAGE